MFFPRGRISVSNTKTILWTTLAVLLAVVVLRVIC